MKKALQKGTLALSLLLASALFLTSCGTPTATGSAATATPAAPVTDPPAVAETDPPVQQTSVKDLPVPEGALDFSDGKTGFLMTDTGNGDADPEVAFDIVDHNGGKALRIQSPGGKTPYVAFDAASLLGGRLGDVRTIEMRVTVDGDFYACSGGFHIFAGENYDVDKSPKWAVYLENKNPNLAVAQLDPGYLFVNGTKNYFMFYKNTDAAVEAGESSRDILIDYVAFYDESGAVIPADSSAEFDPAPGFNTVDNSFLHAVKDAVDLPNSIGECGGWGQAVEYTTLKNDGGDFDPAMLTPDSIVTVYYESASTPELVLQSWSGAPVAWAKVAPFAYNWSGNIAQFRYEDMVAAAGTDDLAGTLDKFIFGATFEAISYSKITIGYKDPDAPSSPLPSAGRLWNLGYTGTTNGGWGQAVAVDTIKVEGGTFDPTEMITPGCLAVVKYESAAAPEIIIQSFETVEGVTPWAKVAPAFVDEENGIAVYTYDDMVTAFGTDDFVGMMDKFNVGDCGEPLTVHGVQFRTV